MKKINLLLTLMLAVCISGFSQFQVISPLTPLTSPAGTSMNISLPSGVSPAGDGVITLYYQGDFDGAGETADLFDENNNLIGTTASGVTQCNASIDSVKFNVTVAQISGWVLDGSVDFTVTPDGTVNPTLCGADNIQIKLAYPPVTGPDDVGASNIGIGTGAVFCSGSQNVTTTIVNAGTNQVTSAMVSWEINGVAQTPVSFSGLLDTLGGTGSQSTIINLGSVAFNPGSTTIRAYTSMPNGVADTSNLNDTISRTAGPSLSGTFTVDAASPTLGTNYNSFTDLSGALTSFGVCGPVNVNVAQGTYSDDLILNSIVGSSAANTITIDGGDSSLVTLSSPNILTNNATVVFNDASYITLKNMTVINPENTTAIDNYVVHFSNSSNYDSLVNLHLIGNSNATFNHHIIGSSSIITNEFGEGDNANFTTVMNCRMVGGDYSVRFEGDVTGSWNVGNKFIGNTLLAMEEYGIYTDQQDSLEIIGNNISGLRTTSTFSGYGTANFDAMNFIIAGNTIDAWYTGIYVTNANSGKIPDRSGEIINNMVYAGTNHGIWTTRGNDIKYLHNSVYCNSISNIDAALFLDDGFGTGLTLDKVDIRNNILFSASGARAMICDEPDSVFIKLDNNIYEAIGTEIVSVDGTNYLDLIALQTGLPTTNQASLQGDPSFFSTKDLHLSGVLANDVGNNSTGVLTDIDGDVRPLAPSTTVDIGADEFLPPACPPPASLTSYGYTDTSAVISWMGTAGNSFEYEVVTAGSGQGSVGNIIGTSAVDTALITGLSAYSLYDFYVREICGRGDTSPWIGPITFRTLCAPFSAPYYNGFETDAANATPGCWEEYFTYSASATAANVWVRNLTGTAAPYAGVQALYIYPQSGFTPGSDTIAAISPQFSDMSAGDKQVRFYANVDDFANNQLVVGTSNTGGAGATFTPLDTIFFTANDTYQEIIVPITTINGYNGTDQYVVLAHSIPSTLANFDYIRIDEFNYEAIPSCPKPQGLGVANLTANSVDLIWNSPSGGTSFEVEYGGPGFTLGSGTTSLVSGAATYSLSGLPAASAYEFYVREICSATDTSVWNGPFAFNTLIQGPVGVNCITGNASVVYTEEFDAIGGWTGNVGTGNSTGNWGFGQSGGTTSSLTGPLGAHSGTNYVYVEATGSLGAPWGNNATMVSPAIDLTAVTDSAELSFWMHAFGQSMGDLTVGIGTSSTGPFTPVFSWLGQLQTVQGDPWQNVGARLDAYVGQTIYIQLDFVIGNNFYSDLGIDLMEITTCISCAIPDALVDSNLNATDVDLAWNQNGSVLGWELEYGPSGFARGSGTSVQVSTLPINVTSLTPATNYDWYVRSFCSVTDTSLWSSVQTFKTPCAPFAATYYNGFENGPINTTPDCWTEFKTYTGATANIWTRALTGTAAPYAGTQAMYIYPLSGFTPGSDTLAAISPIFSDLTAGDKRLRFWANVDDVINNELIVGTTDGAGNFTALDTLTFVANDIYEEFIVDITTANGYNGTDLQIYLAHGLSSTLANFDYIRVDEFRYEVIPTCVRPTVFNSMSTGATTADITWVATSPSVSIEYGPQGFTPGSGTIVSATTSPYTITGLTAGTLYDCYLRAICSPTDSSFQIGPSAFFTTCAAITSTTLPFVEDWETGGSGVLLGGGVVKCGADYSWIFNTSDPRGRVSFGTNAYNVGSAPSTGAVTLDMDPSGVVVVNDLILTLDLAAYTANTNLELLFDAMEHGEEQSPNDSTWIRGSDTSAWVGVFDNFANITSTTAYAAFGPIDIDAALAAAGQTVSSSFQIRFGQEDNFPAPTDGFSFDNIRVQDGTVGIENNEEVSGFTVTPNPSNGVFNLVLNNSNSESFNISILDVSGKEVFTEIVNLNSNTRKQVDLSDFAKGVYFMQIQSGNSTKVEKLIIN